MEQQPGSHHGPPRGPAAGILQIVVKGGRLGKIKYVLILKGGKEREK